MSAVTRFAPSPTGRLHVGNLFTAIHNFLTARKAGGRFILRLDDTDRERSKQEFAEAVETDLAWLGIEPDLAALQPYLVDVEIAVRGAVLYRTPKL